MIRNTLFSWVLLVLSSIILLFIVAPLLGMFLHTSGNQLLTAATDKEVTGSIWLTLWVAFAGTFACAFCAIPLAWFLARRNFPFKKLVMGIIDLPVVLPHTAAGIALLGFISGNGLAGKAASAAGISLINNPAGIAIAMSFVSVPYLINSARDGFAAVPERLEKAALNLGASQSRVFFTISLPLAWRSIVSGFVMMFARGMSEFGAVVIIAYHPMIAPVLIYERFGSYGLNYARPAAVLFVIVALSVFIALRLIPVVRKEKTVAADAEIE